MDAKELLEKYQSGLCSEKEKKQIEKWLMFHNATNSSGLSDEELLELQRKEFTKLEYQIRQRGKSSYLIPIKWSIAATLFFCLTLGGFYISRYARSGSSNRHVNVDVFPGTNIAFLTLANGQRINLMKATKGTIAKQDDIKISKTADGKLVYEVQKGHGYYNSIADQDTIVAGYNSIETPKAGQYQISLPDGTKVWLNAATKLTYPASITDRGMREVTLSGEAYFEVAKDKDHPFIVHTGRQDVKVLGTHFNISSYNDEPQTITTLLEGSVNVSSLRGGSPSSLRGTKQSQTIRPGQQASTGKSEEIKLSTADLQSVIAWKNGRMYFKQADIKTILRQISRWYNVEIIYVGKVSDRRITGGIDRNVKLSAVLETLKENGILIKTDYRSNGSRTLIVQPQSSN